MGSTTGRETVARRHLALGSFAAAAFAAAALYLVGVGSAGTSNYSFTVGAGPATVTGGSVGMIFARFSPNASSGAATHTVITFTIPAVSVASAPSATSADC